MLAFIMKLWVHVLSAFVIFSFLLFRECPGESIPVPAFIGYNETPLNMYLTANNCVEKEYPNYGYVRLSIQMVLVVVVVVSSDLIYPVLNCWV